MMEQNKHRKELEELMAMVVNDTVIAATPEGRDSTRTVVLMNIASSLADIADVLCAGKESIEEDE